MNTPKKELQEILEQLVSHLATQSGNLADITVARPTMAMLLSSLALMGETIKTNPKLVNLLMADTLKKMDEPYYTKTTEFNTFEGGSVN